MALLSLYTPSFFFILLLWETLVCAPHDAWHISIISHYLTIPFRVGFIISFIDVDTDGGRGRDLARMWAELTLATSAVNLHSKFITKLSTGRKD